MHVCDTNFDCMKVMPCSDGVWRLTRSATEVVSFSLQVGCTLSDMSELLCLTYFTALSNILEHSLVAAMCCN